MLTNTTTVNRYLINGTPLATYSISFPYWDKDEIKVYLTESDGTLQTLVENTNYTLSTPNGNNGTLTRVGDWTAGATNLTIAREMSLTQEVDLRNGDKIDAETLETALDDLTAQVQQLAETQERSVTSPIDEAGASLVLPSSSERAGSGSGTIMGFGSGGNSVVLRDLAQFDADVQSASDDAAAARGYATASFNSKELSKEWATSNSIVESTDYSAKKYAEDSKDYAAVVSAHATQIDDIADDLTNLDTVAAAITDVSAVAGKITEVAAVADDLTNIDAVASNKTNIDAVAAVDSEVTTVAGIASDVTTVAGATSDIAAILPDVADVSAVAGDLTKVTAVADDLTNIDNVADDLTNVDTVAGDISNVNAVGGNITNVNAVAGNATNINAVNANKTNIDTVAGKASDITTVAGKANEVSTVAGIASNVTTVATNISDISDVADDIANVSAVAGDLTNIDAVAADLTNIDDAVTYASLSRQYAEGKKLDGIDVTSGEPGYHNNAKYWADAVPALQAQVNANSARITNLEQTTKQDEQTVSYPNDGNYSSIMPNGVPARVTKYASWDNSRGKSRAWNQMVHNGNFADGTSYWTGRDGDSVSVSDGVLTLTASSGTLKGINSDDNYYHVIAGHKYVVSGEIKSSISGVASFAFSSFSGTHSISANQWSNVSRIIDQASTEDISIYFFVQGSFSGGETIQYKNIIVRDLTLIFPEGVPATVADCVKACPDLLKWDAYGTSLVDETLSGVKSVGVNIWDEYWEVGELNVYSGANNPSNENIRSANYIPLVVGESYYVSIPANEIMDAILYYSEAKDYLGIDAAQGINGPGTLTIPPSARFMRFQMNTAYGTTYNHDIQICLNSYADKTTYHPYKTDTLSLSTPVTLRSAGNVAEVLDVQTGKKTRPIGSVNLGTLSWYYDSADTRFYAEIADAKPTDAEIPANYLCAKYVNVSPNVFDLDLPNMAVRGGVGSGMVWIRDTSYNDATTFKNAMNGVTLYYEKATPLSDEQVCDPIPDNYIEVEGGGTINAIQSQTPVIDNCLDVTYDFIPA